MPTIHYTTLHYITLHYTTLHYTVVEAVKTRPLSSRAEPHLELGAVIGAVMGAVMPPGGRSLNSTMVSGGVPAHTIPLTHCRQTPEFLNILG